MSKPQHRKAVFIHSEEIERFAYPQDAPLKTDRAAMTRRILSSMGLLSPGEIVTPRPASREEIEEFHTPRYLDVLQEAEQGRLGVEGLEMGLGTDDCPVFRGMYEYAAMACGASLTGAELIRRKECSIAFNPSGGFHHAGPDYASGFCYLNDVVLACLRLRKSFDRVLFLDVDVHHGDGVQNAFYERSDVCTISMHESGRTLFPGTGFVGEIGEGEGRGYSVNVPLPPGTGDDLYLKAFRSAVLPLVRAYDPQVVVVELGMDGLSGDPLAHLNLSNNAYAEVVQEVMALDRPVLATGGGGYHPRNTARAWALVWTIFTAQADDDDTASLGLGGVMLESTDWSAGLRDRRRTTGRDEERRAAVEVERTIEEVKNLLFPLHGLG